MTDVKLGSIITEPAGRDAVHVAVIAMRAVKVMQPGERLANGIVDPFLLAPVEPGQRFWLCLFPGTVTSLRHVWAHPAYPDEEQPAAKQRSEADVWRDMQETQAEVAR